MAWLENIHAQYDDFKLEVTRWDFPDKGITAVWGPSGSGKSTLLALMAGLLPSQLRLCVRDELISELPPSHRHIGFVFQDDKLFPHLTVRENLSLEASARRIPRDVYEARSDELAKKLKLAGLLERHAGLLSGGERKRVALARALMLKPRMVLLDEPFASLDLELRHEARDLLLQMAEENKIPFILVTHDWIDVKILAQSIMVLRGGRFLGAGSVQDVLARPASREMALALPDFQEVLLKGASVSVVVKKTETVLCREPGGVDVIGRGVIRLLSREAFGTWARLILGEGSREDRSLAVEAYASATDFAVGDKVEVGLLRGGFRL